MPALNLAICWKLWNIDFAQSVGNLLSSNFLGVLRDNTPEFICCIVLFFHCFPIYPIKQVIKLSIRYELYKNYTTSNNGSNTYLSSYVAGLIEGDGTIHVPKTERSNKGNLNYPSIQIAKLFQSTVKPIRVEGPNPQYRVRTTNMKANLAVIDYLTKYPLFGTKFLDFQDWVKVVNLFQAGRMDHKFNMAEAKLIKSQMNDNRTIFLQPDAFIFHYRWVWSDK